MKGGFKDMPGHAWTCMDMHAPFACFNLIETIRHRIKARQELVETSEINPSAALEKYRANMMEDLRVCWSTWVPAFLFNFSVCPLWARVPFVAVISFGFTTYFSFLRGAPQSAAPGTGETR